MADKAYLDKDGLAEVWSAVEDQVAEASEEIIKVKTVSGDIVSVDDASAYPALDVKVDIEPVQEGTPWMAPTVDTAPYLLRPSPDLDHDYNSKIDTLVGGTIAWNQKVQNGNFADTSEWIADNATFSVANNIGSVTYTDNSGYIYQNYDYVNSHKYLVSFDCKAAQINKAVFRIYYGDYNASQRVFNSVSTNWEHYSSIIAFASTGTVHNFRLYSDANTNQFRNVYLIDLTATFGTEIADYVYSLEQATAGSGIAWLKSYGFLTKDYYAYNDGSLVSVKTSEHRTTGKNLLEITATTTVKNGVTFTVNSDGSVKANGTADADTFFYLQNNIESWLKEGEQYIMTGHPGGTSNQVTLAAIINRQPSNTWVYDVGSGVTFTAGKPSGTAVLRCEIQITNGQTVNNLVFKPMIRRADVSDATFEPYESHYYPLDSDLELRGIPKLSNGSLYYDGDEYRADGTVTRKYGIVDLGTLNWAYRNGYSAFSTTDINTLTKTYADSQRANAICSRYQTISASVHSQSDKVVWINVYGSLWVKDSAYTDAQTFKTAMSGVYLVYELATPTTEQADPFTSPQIVSPLGTEEYVDNRSVPIPVGHKTSYADIYPISGWDKVNIFNSPTGDEEDAKIYIINLGGTYYGGLLDVTRGVMNVTYGLKDLDGSYSWAVSSSNGFILNKGYHGIDVDASKISISNLFPYSQTVWTDKHFGFNSSQTLWIGDTGLSTFGSLQDLKDVLNSSPLQICYPLINPFIVQLTPQQIELLQNTNHIWADTGDTTLKYAVMGDDMYDFAAANKVYIDQLVEEKDSRFSPVGFSGELVSFKANQEYPLLDLNVDINPVQDLHGYSKPWAPGNGKNLFNKSIATESTQCSVEITATGLKVITKDAGTNRSMAVEVISDLTPYIGQTFTFSCDATSTNTRVCAIQIMDGSTEKYWASSSASSVSLSVTITSDYSGCLLRLRFYSTGGAPAGAVGDYAIYSNIQFEKGASKTSYEPYSNICTISGWDEVNIPRTGKNLMSQPIISLGGTEPRSKIINFDKPLLAGTYIASWKVSGTYTGTATNAGINVADSEVITTINKTTGQFTIDRPATNLYFYFPSVNYNNGETLNYSDFQIEFSTTATDYEPYNGNTFTIDLGETRYGCKLNVPSGKLVVTHNLYTGLTAASVGTSSAGYKYADVGFTGLIEDVEVRCSHYIQRSKALPAELGAFRIYNNAITIYDNRFSSKSEADSILSDIQWWVPLSTPVEIQLEPTEITTLLGTNYIWADTGDIDGQYAQLTDDFKDLSMADRRAMSILIEQKLREYNLI